MEGLNVRAGDYPPSLERRSGFIARIPLSASLRQIGYDKGRGGGEPANGLIGMPQGTHSTHVRDRRSEVHLRI
jgi:hypothetical protein